MDMPPKVKDVMAIDLAPEENALVSLVLYVKTNRLHHLFLKVAVINFCSKAG